MAEGGIALEIATVLSVDGDLVGTLNALGEVFAGLETKARDLTSTVSNIGEGASAITAAFGEAAEGVLPLERAIRGIQTTTEETALGMKAALEGAFTTDFKAVDTFKGAIASMQSGFAGLEASSKTQSNAVATNWELAAGRVKTAFDQINAIGNAPVRTPGPGPNPTGTSSSNASRGAGPNAPFAPSGDPAFGTRDDQQNAARMNSDFNAVQAAQARQQAEADRAKMQFERETAQAEAQAAANAAKTGILENDLRYVTPVARAQNEQRIRSQNIEDEAKEQRRQAHPYSEEFDSKGAHLPSVFSIEGIISYLEGQKILHDTGAEEYNASKTAQTMELADPKTGIVDQKYLDQIRRNEQQISKETGLDEVTASKVLHDIAARRPDTKENQTPDDVIAYNLEQARDIGRLAVLAKHSIGSGDVNENVMAVDTMHRALGTPDDKLKEVDDTLLRISEATQLPLTQIQTAVTRGSGPAQMMGMDETKILQGLSVQMQLLGQQGAVAFEHISSSFIKQKAISDDSSQRENIKTYIQAHPEHRGFEDILLKDAKDNVKKQPLYEMGLVDEKGLPTKYARDAEGKFDSTEVIKHVADLLAQANKAPDPEAARKVILQEAFEAWGLQGVKGILGATATPETYGAASDRALQHLSAMPGMDADMANLQQSLQFRTEQVSTNLTNLAVSLGHSGVGDALGGLVDMINKVVSGESNLLNSDKRSDRLAGDAIAVGGGAALFGGTAVGLGLLGRNLFRRTMRMFGAGESAATGAAEAGALGAEVAAPAAASAIPAAASAAPAVAAAAPEAVAAGGGVAETAAAGAGAAGIGAIAAPAVAGAAVVGAMGLGLWRTLSNRQQAQAAYKQGFEVERYMGEGIAGAENPTGEIDSYTKGGKSYTPDEVAKILTQQQAQSAAPAAQAAQTAATPQPTQTQQTPAPTQEAADGLLNAANALMDAARALAGVSSPTIVPTAPSPAATKGAVTLSGPRASTPGATSTTTVPLVGKQSSNVPSLAGLPQLAYNDTGTMSDVGSQILPDMSTSSDTAASSSGQFLAGNYGRDVPTVSVSASGTQYADASAGNTASDASGTVVAPLGPRATTSTPTTTNPQSLPWLSGNQGRGGRSMLHSVPANQMMPGADFRDVLAAHGQTDLLSLAGGNAGTVRPTPQVNPAIAAAQNASTNQLVSGVSTPVGASPAANPFANATVGTLTPFQEMQATQGTDRLNLQMGEQALAANAAQTENTNPLMTSMALQQIHNQMAREGNGSTAGAHVYHPTGPGSQHFPHGTRTGVMDVGGAQRLHSQAGGEYRPAVIGGIPQNADGDFNSLPPGMSSGDALQYMSNAGRPPRGSATSIHRLSGTQQPGSASHGARSGGTPAALAATPYGSGELARATGATSQEYQAFNQALSKIESHGQYNIMGGSSGRFAGRYQMGADEIRDTAASLGVPAPTREQYLHDPKMQDQFFERYTLNHHKYLMNHNPAYSRMTPEQKLAALGYAHNQGAGGASSWINSGKAGADAFGTSGAVYPAAIAHAISALPASDRDHNASQTAAAQPTKQADGSVDVNMTPDQSATQNAAKLGMPSPGQSGVKTKTSGDWLAEKYAPIPTGELSDPESRAYQEYGYAAPTGGMTIDHTSHNYLHVDGEEMAANMTRHQVRAMNGANNGVTGYDSAMTPASPGPVVRHS